MKQFSNAHLLKVMNLLYSLFFFLNESCFFPLKSNFGNKLLINFSQPVFFKYILLAYPLSLMNVFDLNIL